MRYKRCIMILADGSRYDVFKSLLDAGELPHIERHITSPGGLHLGTTVFPSTTGPAYLPFLTGCQPSTCNVPGIRWMNKSLYKDGTRRGLRSYVGLETLRFNRDISKDVETIFNIIPRSYNIFNAVNRGVHTRRNISQLMRVWYWYYAHLTDRWGFLDEAATKRLHDIIKKDFQFCFAVFPGIDEYSHMDNPNGERTYEAYRHLDRTVGSLAQRLERQQQSEDTLWWIVSDHGLSATRHHFCVNNYMEKRGIKSLFYPVVYKRGAEVANMMSGNGMTHLYFKHKSGWGEATSYDYLQTIYPGLLDELLLHPAVDLIAARIDKGETSANQKVLAQIIVRTVDGEAKVTFLSNQTIKYEALRGDPLFIGAADLTMSKEECLRRTINTKYPDGPYQLAHLFISDRTGDVVISATPGYDLRLAYETPEHKGSHGSLHQEHMHIPIVCSAPLSQHPLRSTDVFPTTLELMGFAAPQNIDGVSRVAA